MRFYDSVEEVRRRLGQCVILYQNQPVLVGDGCALKKSLVGKTRFGVIVRNLPLMDRTWKVPLDDPDLNFRQLRLGFINRGRQVFRLERAPFRSTFQGLNENNVHVKTLDGNRTEFSLTRALDNQDTCDSFAGRYPTIDAARAAILGNEADECAFHYDWAWIRVYGIPALHYKTRPVGACLEQNKIIKLEPHMHYLREPLEEIGVTIES